MLENYPIELFIVYKFINMDPCEYFRGDHNLSILKPQITTMYTTNDDYLLLVENMALQ